MTVARQIMWTRLIAVVEEQARTLIRTAFSTSVREAGDLSAGVYDLSGRMLAQAVTGTPGHVNAMAAAVAHFIREIGPETMAEGDHYITNDPWMGTGHLHDITVVSPAFHRGAHVGYFGCTAHVVDIGGRGLSAEAASLYEEGLQIPILRLIDRGRVNETLMALIRQNVREPEQVAGDVFALAACNDVGIRRLSAMMDEYGIAGLEDLSAFILGQSEAGTRARIAALPPGRHRGEMRIDGHGSPIDLRVEVAIAGDRITADFAGTSGEDPKGINVPLIYTTAYAAYALKVALAPDIPNNAGSLAPFVVTAPPGSILNARRPAPVALRHVTGHLIPDTIYAALAPLLPDLIPAEGASALCNFQLSLRPLGPGGRRAEIVCFNSGGTGGRPGLDGLSATAFPSGVMTMPVEATEHAGPVVIWRKELREGSGGAGEFRGGLGQVMEIGPRPGHALGFSAMFDRARFPARGRHGGLPGAPTEVALSDGTPMPPKGRYDIPEGQRIRLAFAGGGGWGDPARRDPAALARDLRRGYLSEEQARRDYGWHGP